MSSLEFWYIELQRNRMFAQSFRSGLFSACIFLETRNDLVSCSSTFSITEYTFTSSLSSSLSAISVERVKKNKFHKGILQKKSHLFDVSLQSQVYSTSYTMFFLFCESSDTRGSLLHTWSIENIQRCEVSTPNAPGESEKTLQRDFPDRAVPIALLNPQLWYVCVKFWSIEEILFVTLKEHWELKSDLSYNSWDLF